jgi:spermidine/putrescine-binding protein
MLHWANLTHALPIIIYRWGALEDSMRILLQAVVLTLASMCFVSPATAQDASLQTSIFRGYMGSDVAGEPYDVKIALLQNQARKFAKADGGRLSGEHVELLEARLNKINYDEYLRWRGF